MYKYYILYKPFGMLSQFSKEGNRTTLADLDFKFPKDAYPVGRLDADSEGLLVLTNDASVNKKLLDPEEGHKRVYYVQVENEITDEACLKLKKGVKITLEGNSYTTRPCEAKPCLQPENIPVRNPPIRVRKAIPDSWIKLELTEGKNRQIRKMTAAVGFPTLRLIRFSIEKITIENFEAGQVKELSKNDFISNLQLK